MDILVRRFTPGEQDLILRDIVRRGRELFGERHNLFVRPRFVLGFRSGVEYVVGDFVSDVDRERPAPDRRQRYWGIGRSWDEAFNVARLNVLRGTPVGGAKL